jgi:endogenous inhibitor of DNA gyrase (YacG/DUF329 family)
MKQVICLICGKKELVSLSRAKGYKTCSRSCMGKRASLILSENITKTCPVCNKKFKLKRSSFRRRQYCSKICQAIAYKTRYLGTNNPNFRPDHKDAGYNYAYRIGRIFLHKQVVLDYLNIKIIPKNLFIHHRDCDKRNNVPENLVLLNASDHNWLHRQYGSAVLWAYLNNKISKDQLIEWSNDKDRARRLLDLNITNQSAVLKFCEFGETPEVDDTEPSVKSNFNEGVTTSSESQADNNTTTSAGQG